MILSHFLADSLWLCACCLDYTVPCLIQRAVKFASLVLFLPCDSSDPQDPPYLFPSGQSYMVPIVAASPLSFFAMTNAWFNRVCFVSFGVQVSTTRCRFQSSPTFQIEPWFLFARTSLLVVKLSEGIFSVYSWNKSYLVLGISCVKLNHLPLNEDIARIFSYLWLRMLQILLLYLSMRIWLYLSMRMLHWFILLALVCGFYGFQGLMLLKMEVLDGFYCFIF